MKVLRRILRILLVLFLLLNVLAAFHAYKFTHFYPGESNRPKVSAAMTGWDKTKALLFGLTYPKSVNSSKPAGYETVTLQTKDGLQIEGWYSGHPAARGTVLMFHGHGSSKSKLDLEAAAFSKMGYNLLLVDFRAHGGSDGTVCTIGYYESEEVKLAYEYIRAKGEKNIILWGISLGAGTITHAIAEYGLQPEKVILEMPFGTLLDAVKGRLRIMGVPAEPFSSLLTFWGGAEQGFWAFSMEPETFARKINCPLLVQWGAKDARVTRKEVESIYRNAASIAKELVVYPDAAHESLCKKDPERWLRTVRAFLERQN